MWGKKRKIREYKNPETILMHHAIVRKKSKFGFDLPRKQRRKM